MHKDNLVSLSGDPIFRYSDGEKEWESPKGEESLEEISDHIEKHIGNIEMVYHEIVSDTVHIDVHHVAPTKERPFHTLITSGMSDLPMVVPTEYEAPKHLELMATLPEHWKVDQESFQNEEWYWPVRQLKIFARFPHKHDTWLGFGHTMPNGDPAEPYAPNTRLNGAILLPSILVPEEFWVLNIGNNKKINFLSIVPLYEEEMNLKLRKGSDELLDKFGKYEITDLVDINRKNVAKRKFGFF